MSTKEDHAAYMRQYYRDNQAKLSTAMRERERKNGKRAVNNLLRCRRNKMQLILHFGGRCMDCSMELVDYPECADFDHVRGEKKFDLSAKSWSYARLLVEAEKCDLVCANCHRKRTAQRNRDRSRAHAAIAAMI